MCTRTTQTSVPGSAADKFAKSSLECVCARVRSREICTPPVPQPHSHSAIRQWAGHNYPLEQRRWYTRALAHTGRRATGNYGHTRATEDVHIRLCGGSRNILCGVCACLAMMSGPNIGARSFRVVRASVKTMCADDGCSRCRRCGYACPIPFSLNKLACQTLSLSPALAGRRRHVEYRARRM